MEMAALHLFPRNTVRKMPPTISQFKTSLSPSPPSFCSFSRVPSLWCATPLRLECQNTTITGLNVIKCAHRWIPPSQSKEEEQQQRDPFSERLDNAFGDNGRKRPRDPERHPNEPGNKRPRPEGEYGESQMIYPASTEGEWKDGGTEASGYLSVNVGVEIMEDGEFALKIRRMSPGSTHDEVERAEQMAQNAAMLLLHAEMLQDMGQKLLAQSQASFRSILGMPAPPIRNSDS